MASSMSVLTQKMTTLTLELQKKKSSLISCTTSRLESRMPGPLNILRLRFSYVPYSLYETYVILRLRYLVKEAPGAGCSKLTTSLVNFR